MSAEIVVVDTQDVLTKRERAAYQLSVSRKEPFLSPILADQLYSLFESGKTCEEIQGLNKGISIGIIVRARVDFGWDERRRLYFDSLRERARTQAQNLALESLSFLGDLLNTFHRHDRVLLQRFVQTQDPSELKDVLTTGSGFKTYQSIVELLMKLTGQDTDTKTIQGTIEHHHTLETIKSAPLTPEQASNLLLGSK